MLIVGGGMVGGTLAIALSQAGLAVVVVDAEAPAAALEPSFDGRFSAIALASRRVLAALGLWPALDRAAAPILDIRVTEGDSLLFLHYHHREAGDQPFGYMVENRAFRRALARCLPACANLRVMAPARIAAIERAAGGVEARLVDGRVLRARLVVGADGRGSLVRASAGIRLTRWSYGQHAIVCTVAHEKPHGSIAHEHFLPAGPFAILPVRGRRSNIVWTERAEIAPALVTLPDDEFVQELGGRFGDFLGRLTLTGPRWSYPLALQFAEDSIATRLALIGDASHALHPIAGQGLNMGLRDVAALSEALVDGRRLGLEAGDAGPLARYQRWRRFDNTLMLAATDGLNRLFSNDFPPLRLARDLGLAMVDRLAPAKRFFMRQAMGEMGELPRLMRGEPL